MTQKFQMTFSVSLILLAISSASPLLCYADNTENSAAANPKASASPSISESLHFKDRVRSIEDSGSSFQVTFQQHAAIYRLPKDGSQAVFARLQSSLSKGKPIGVDVNPDSLNILRDESK